MSGEGLPQIHCQRPKIHPDDPKGRVITMEMEEHEPHPWNDGGGSDPDDPQKFAYFWCPGWPLPEET